MTPPKKPSLESLQRTWYKKLADSGFKDIEREDGSLTYYASARLVKAVRDGKEEWLKSSEEYYRAAGQFLWEHTFKDERERRIWELHSQGMSARRIGKEIGPPYREKDTIQKIINAIADVMGIKCRR